MSVQKISTYKGDIAEHKRIEKNLENARIAARNVYEDLLVEKERLAEAKAIDEAMLASIGEGLIATGKDGNILLANRAFENLLYWKESEIQGKFLSQVVPMIDEDGKIVPESERLINKAIREKSPEVRSAAGYYKRKDGTIFPVATIVSPIILGKNFLGVVEVFRDITKEREIDKAKNEFVSLASHQLRTPMTAINWVAEMLEKREHLTDEGKRYVADIKTSTAHLSGLVDLLLNVSRIEEGKIAIAPKPIELVSFVHEYLKENESLAADKNLKLIFSTHPQSLNAVTDPTVFRNIIQVLVSNAIEYTPGGGKIEISLAEDKKGGTFIFGVSDTGIGIPKEEQSKIFTKFMRGSNAKLLDANGTGLGMYIAHQGTKLLGGTIWFVSVENKGSTFFVELPMESRASEKQEGAGGRPMVS